jgi:hypothetical protein
MSIESILLIIETVLLTATVVLLIHSTREAALRKRLLTKIERATETLTRVEYFSLVNRAILEAKREIIAYVTGAYSPGADEREIRIILDHLREAKNRGLKIRYILPKLHDRLHMGSKYVDAGAEVKYRPGLFTHSLRYMIIDEKEVVIGVPGRVGKREMTRKGYWIPSKALARIIKSHFGKNWIKGIRYDDYLARVLEDTGASTDSLAIELGVDVTLLKRANKKET